MSLAISAAEKGWVPEPLLRWGIRRLLRERRMALAAGGTEARRERFEAHLAAMEKAPLALATSEANEQHYEVPAEFFVQVLGRHLKYSSCLWEDGVSSLDEAEAAMLRLSCERASLEDGMRVLDLGCGWGSLSLWIAESFPRCRITAVSNSALQRRFIEERLAAGGLSNLRVVTADMNDFEADGRFDRVVSIEMFEHMRNWKALFRRIARWLEPEGKLFFHVFCHREMPYFFETGGSGNWMGRNFFTGGMMPSETLPFALMEDLTVESHWRVPGLHYARTSQAWEENLRARRQEILEVFSRTYGPREARRWWGRWRLFFLACEELFGYSSGEEWFVSHYLASR